MNVLAGTGGSAAPMNGYPKIFNIEADPREEHNIGAMYEWVIGPGLKSVEQYKALPHFSLRVGVIGTWATSCCAWFRPTESNTSTASLSAVVALPPPRSSVRIASMSCSNIWISFRVPQVEQYPNLPRMSFWVPHASQLKRVWRVTSTKNSGGAGLPSSREPCVCSINSFTSMENSPSRSRLCTR